MENSQITNENVDNVRKEKVADIREELINCDTCKYTRSCKDYESGVRFRSKCGGYEKYSDTSEYVSIHMGSDNNPDGVIVRGLGECFVISLHDLDNGRSDFSYNTLMPRLKELGIQTFTKKQAQIVCFFLDEINDKLIEAGGDPFEKDWYLTQDLYIPSGSSADYYASSSWSFNGTNGCLNNNNRYNGNFRSRPVLAL